MAKPPSSRRSYKELRADPTIKVPFVAWLLDRTLLYVAIGVVTAFAVGAFLYEGYKANEEIWAPAEKDSPYMELNPSRTAGARWAVDFVAKERNIDGWDTISSTQPTHGLLQDATGATAGEVPMTMLTATAGASGATKSVVQIYGAGQARPQYDVYVDRISARTPIDSQEIDDSGVVGGKFDHGFIFVAGDSIVAFQTASNEERDELFGIVLEDLKTSLPASGCLDISGTNSSTRSLYYDEGAFTGLLESQEVDPEVATTNLPTVRALGTGEIANPYAAQPEAPLPESLPAPPAEVSKPTVASMPETVESFSELASYKVQDPDGPGCGWDWSAQKPLVYDDTDLAAAREDTIVAVQNQVNDEAQAYVDSKISWARSVALISPKINSWNSYVNAVNNVHGLWDKLVADRESLRPSWDAYVDAHDEWSSFDQRKADATKNYNEELKLCKENRKAHDKWEKEMEEWEKKYGSEEEQPEEPTAPTPSPTPTPTPDPPKEPEDCPEDPVRPEIMDQSKPAEPQAPEIPEDVTIPDSWRKPQ